MTSPYYSPTVLVKKAGGFALISELNDVIIFYAEPVPRTDEALGNYAGDKYFTEIYLCKGYCQIPLADDSKHLTAFACSTGLMQFTKCLLD